MRSKCESSKSLALPIAASAIGAIIALFPSCSPGNPGGDPPKTTSVYVAGYYDGQACYWKGTTRTDLPVAGAGSSAANGIDASEGVVYSAGEYWVGSIKHACYWEGTTGRELPGDGIHSAYAKAIDVSGGIAYTAGNYFDGSKSIPCYWVGATRYDLPLAAGDNAGLAYGIAVVGGTVYVCGRYALSDWSYVACYWTDTALADATRTDLECIVAAEPHAYGIYVSGISVYVAGTYFDSATMRFYPCYWKDGARIDLRGSVAGNSETSGIIASGGTVLTSGYYQDGADSRACYWNGTDRFDLPNGASAYCFTSSIAAIGGEAYVAGYYYDGDKDIPCYWKDGSKTDLPGGAADAYTTGIVVVEE
jgi:uncharacterized membrane protein